MNLRKVLVWKTKLKEGKGLPFHALVRYDNTSFFVPLQKKMIGPTADGRPLTDIEALRALLSLCIL